MKTWTTKNGQKIHRISNGVYNCFLISCRGKHLLVDTGRKQHWKKLRQKLDKLGVADSSLTGLILTHSHYDHAGNTANIKETFNPRIMIHKREADYLRSGKNPAIHGTTFFTGFITEGLSHWYLMRFCGYKPVDCDITVEDRYDLNDFGFNAYFLHTPGHTPGSISVIIENEIAIVGDALFGVLQGSAWPPVATDSGLMVESWERLLNTGCSIYLPAHGTERSRELLQRQYKKHKRIQDQRL
jgi:hydroxyacylglutathione hydrolase